MNNASTADLLKKISIPQCWNTQPVYCFTTDIDWASEAVILQFLKSIPFQELKMTAFVTHNSDIIQKIAQQNIIDRGIHPSFLPNSSHGNTYREVIQNCLSFAPEAQCVRAHRFFSVSDTAHLLHNEFNFNYSSNVLHLLMPNIQPYLHESQMIEFPIFWEEGTALYNQLGLSIHPYLSYFDTPGLKIISFHPINVTFNTPNIPWMRQIKDSLSREEFANISDEIINRKKNLNHGIYYTIMEIINYIFQKKYPIISLNTLYQNIVNYENS